MEFAKRVPKPKIAINPEQLKVQKREILKHSPLKTELQKLMEQHESSKEEVTCAFNLSKQYVM